MKLARLLPIVCLFALSTNSFGQLIPPTYPESNYRKTVYDLCIAEQPESIYVLYGLVDGEWEKFASSTDDTEIERYAVELMDTGIKIEVEKFVPEPRWELFDTYDNEAEAEIFASRLERMGFMTKITPRTYSPRPTYPRR